MGRATFQNQTQMRIQNQGRRDVQPVIHRKDVKFCGSLQKVAPASSTKSMGHHLKCCHTTYEKTTAARDLIKSFLNGKQAQEGKSILKCSRRICVIWLSISILDS